MGKDKNPVQNKGYRNVFCPYYRTCLDHASKHYWECWTCLDCRHKQEHKSATDVLLSPACADAYYSLSPSFYRKTKSTLK
jgi:hypothetical protein